METRRFKIPENGLIPFAKRGESKINNNDEFETEILDIDLKWVEDCLSEEIEEFKNKGFVEKTDTNYDKKLEKLKLKLRTSLIESNVTYEKKPYFIKSLNLPYKTKTGGYEPHIYKHHFNDLSFCRELVDEVDSRNPDDWIYYPIGMFLDYKIFMDIESEYSYQDIVNFLDWFENYLNFKYEFVGDKILFGNKIIKIEDIFKGCENENILPFIFHKPIPVPFGEFKNPLPMMNPITYELINPESWEDGLHFSPNIFDEKYETNMVYEVKNKKVVRVYKNLNN